MLESASLPLATVDPELAKIIQAEHRRQAHGLELIASENFTSRAVMECLGSVLTNKYSEGQPGARYYGGNGFIDTIERLAKSRALTAFGLNPSEWAVNVQPYSGSPANFAVYTGLLPPHARIMGLDLPSGGHLTHGFYTPKKRISATSLFWESLPYSVGADGRIDFAALRKSAEVFRPSMIICGASAYPRVLDFAQFADIAKSVGALLMADIAHIAGLVAAGAHPSPFPHCDIVTTTTHKSLRGPRAGMIFCRRELAEKIDTAVFPMLQGGPHNHQIAAIATQMREVATPEFKAYAEQVVVCARALGEALIAKGHVLVTGGTDNHLVLWDVRPLRLTGNKVERVLELAAVTANKNTIPGDKSALTPGGLRLGVCAMVTRGFTAADFARVADILDRAARIAQELAPPEAKYAEFNAAAEKSAAIAVLKAEVEGWAAGFAFPGGAPPLEHEAEAAAAH